MTKSEINSELIDVRDISVHLGQISAPFAIVKSSDLNFVYANELYHQLLNHDQLIGKKVDEVFSQNPHYPILLRAAISKEKVFKPKYFWQKVQPTSTNLTKIKPSSANFNLLQSTSTHFNPL